MPKKKVTSPCINYNFVLGRPSMSGLGYSIDLSFGGTRQESSMFLGLERWSQVGIERFAAQRKADLARWWNNWQWSWLSLPGSSSSGISIGVVEWGIVGEMVCTSQRHRNLVKIRLGCLESVWCRMVVESGRWHWEPASPFLWGHYACRRHKFSNAHGPSVYLVLWFS